MSDKGIHLVRAHLAKLPPSSTLTIAERRAQYERAERVFPTPPDVPLLDEAERAIAAIGDFVRARVR